MKWTVLWLPDAEQALASLWMNASDPDAVTDAANALDKILSRNPESAGESRSDGRRILFVRPLGILYRVYADDRKVLVSHVWRF